MSNELKTLIDKARQVPVTAEDREAQRRSFAFGNTAFENRLITREMIDEQAEALSRENGGKSS
ncbi:MAG: hypothetical protein EXQ87_07335 [Alphaproteobacteria bacterium]|nr:hypothetical protein [Alphaproteobacteria bacterium]